jgi:dTDP-4-dehydrorhamnose reductase
MSKLNILVTGANGQLGKCIQDFSKRLPEGECRFFFTDIDTLDICDAGQIERRIVRDEIDVIVNAAAYTAVDKAEDNIADAYRINRDAVDNLAKCAKRRGVYLVHISTDYVFSGDECRPHREEDPIAPRSVYGKSKAEGEQAIRDSGCHATIIRTSWLYSEYGHNFVKTMLKLGRERERVTVVYDQIGGPTYAGDLVSAIWSVIEKNGKSSRMNVYHFANKGSISWFDFAQAIMEIGGCNCRVDAILSENYPAKAPRPACSVFDLSKIESETGIDIPYWRDSLKLTISKLEKI